MKDLIANEVLNPVHRHYFMPNRRVELQERVNKIDTLRWLKKLKPGELRPDDTPKTDRKLGKVIRNLAYSCIP